MEKVGWEKGLVCSPCVDEWDHKSITKKEKKIGLKFLVSVVGRRDAYFFFFLF